MYLSDGDSYFSQIPVSRRSNSLYSCSGIKPFPISGPPRGYSTAETCKAGAPWSVSTGREMTTPHSFATGVEIVVIIRMVRIRYHLQYIGVIPAYGLGSPKDRISFSFPTRPNGSGHRLQGSPRKGSVEPRLIMPP